MIRGGCGELAEERRKAAGTMKDLAAYMGGCLATAFVTTIVVALDIAGVINPWIGVPVAVVVFFGGAYGTVRLVELAWRADR